MEPDERLFLPPSGSGGDPVQELAFALATGIAVLDAVKASGDVPEEDFPKIVEDQLFCQRGHPFYHRDVQDARLRDLWDEITLERYGVEDENTAASAMAQVNCLASPNCSRKTMFIGYCSKPWP